MEKEILNIIQIKKNGIDLMKLKLLNVIGIHCNLVGLSITNHSIDIHNHEESEMLICLFPNVHYKSNIKITM